MRRAAMGCRRCNGITTQTRAFPPNPTLRHAARQCSSCQSPANENTFEPNATKGRHMSTRHAVVTGGAGFLGSFVCERLLEEGYRVTCVDSLLTGRLANLQGIIDLPNFQFINGDVRHDLPSDRCDEIWNLASPASPPIYQRDPIDTLLVNVNGTDAVLQKALRDRAIVFQASTSEVYGDPDISPQDEAYRGNVNTTGPRACYDEGKRAAEALCFDYTRKFNVDVRVARIFNTYGPRMDPLDGRVVSNFVVNALKGFPLELYGGGQQTRSFCYVSDLVDGFFALMRHPNRVGFPVNIGNPTEFTIRQLGDLVLELTGSSSSFVTKPMPDDDPKQRRPDILRASTLLGWTPQVPLREGLTKMIAHFRSTVL